MRSSRALDSILSSERTRYLRSLAFGVRTIALSFCLVVACLLPALATSPLLAGYAALKETAVNAVPYEAAIADSKPLMVEFYADWCSVCRGMAPTIARLHEEYGDRINFVMLDIDDPRWEDEIERFGVPGVPFYAFLGSVDGRTELLDSALVIGERQVVRTLVGRHPTVVMTSAIESLMEPSI